MRRPPTRPGVRRGRVRREIVDRARRRGDALEPARDARVGSHVVARLVRHARVGVERAVRHGVPPGGDELLPREPSLERRQRSRTGLVMARERLGPLGVPAGQPPEARRADVRLEQVLLEEHPGVHVRALDRVGGKERRALGEVEQDRARLGDRAAVDLEQRRPPGRVPGEVLVGLGVAGEDVGGDPLVGKVELREQHPHLEAVGRGGEVVEPEERRSSVSVMWRKRWCHAMCEMQPRERLKPLRR